jgi:hypothetical protein
MSPASPKNKKKLAVSEKEGKSTTTNGTPPKKQKKEPKSKKNKKQKNTTTTTTTTTSPSSSPSQKKNEAKIKEVEIAEHEDDEEEEEEEEDEIGLSSPTAGKKRKRDDDSKPAQEPKSVFVTNLATSTSQDSIKYYFQKAGNVQSVYLLQRKPNFIHTTQTAFVNFEKPEEATAALKLNNTILDGATIDVVLQVPRGTQLSKIEVKVDGLPENLQASEVVKVFEAFGVVRGVKFLHTLNFTHIRGVIIVYAHHEDAEKAVSLNESTTAFPGATITVKPNELRKSPRQNSSPRIGTTLRIGRGGGRSGRGAKGKGGKPGKF